MILYIHQKRLIYFIDLNLIQVNQINGFYLYANIKEPNPKEYLNDSF